VSEPNSVAVEGKVGKLRSTPTASNTFVPTLSSVLLGWLEGSPDLESILPLLSEPAGQLSLAAIVDLLADVGVDPDRILITLSADVSLKPPTFGERLRSLRQQANLSQESLAKRIGVPTGTVGQCETGRRSHTFKMVVKVCKALKVDLNTFADCDLEDDSDKSDD
jgi:DNA-binding XRE family transcriptional regulator